MVNSTYAQENLTSNSRIENSFSFMQTLFPGGKRIEGKKEKPGDCKVYTK